LQPDKEDIFTVNISAPTDAKLGDKATLTVLAKSSGTDESKTLGPYDIIVSEKAGLPPELKFSNHYPDKPVKGEQLTFFADFVDVDGDDINAKICTDKNCSSTYCMLAGNQTKKDDQTLAELECSIEVKLDPGTYTYYIFANDSTNLSMLSYPKQLIVLSAPVPEKQQKNIALLIYNISADASSSRPGERAENAFDNDTSTYWSSLKLPAELKIDFKDIKVIDGFGIFSERTNRPDRIEFLVSEDCIEYKKVYESKNITYGPDNWFRARFKAAKAKCAKLVVKTSEDGSDTTSLASLEIYEAPEDVVQKLLKKLPPTVQCAQDEVFNQTSLRCEKTITTKPVPPDNTLLIIVIIIIAAISSIVIIILYRNRIMLKYFFG